MTYSYNLTTDIGKMRLRLNDNDPASPTFQDEELQAFLDIEYNVLKNGIALALETLATNEALVLKVIKTLQLSTDGAKLAAELRAQAKALRDQAANDLNDPAQAYFDFAQWGITPQNRYEIYDKAIEASN